MRFDKWIKTYIEEKGINPEFTFEVEKENSIFGTNIISVNVVIEAMCAAPKEIRSRFKKDLVWIDFLNKPVMPYLRLVAKKLAI